MVFGSSVLQPDVVESGSSQNHIGFDLWIMDGNLQAALDDVDGMITLVCAIELVVAGENL